MTTAASLAATRVPFSRQDGPLSAEALAQFDAGGWVAAPGFFSTAEIAEIAGWTQELLDRPERPGAHWIYRQPSLLDPARKVVQRVENFCPHHDGFDALARRSRLTRAVEQVLAGPVALFKEKINYKEPGGAGFKLHQDQQAGWSRYAPLFVTVLVCIDPATTENGCLQMADGLPRLDHLIADEWRPIGESEASGFAMRDLPTQPGDVAFFDSFVPHASQDNLSPHGRRLLFFTYNSADHGDVREPYHVDKRANCPPDIEREPGSEYQFRV
jgi:2-aminoethylphosphonate dioxygenase